MSTKSYILVPAIALISIFSFSACSYGSQEDSNPEIANNTTATQIDPSKIISGGPAKDGIPSIDNPGFESIENAETYLDENDLGIAVTFDDVSRFYPNKILVWHEIVNDNLGEHSAVVTYCPLCGTGIVFEPLVNGKVSEFGTSGKLYNSNLVMYDRQTDSYWSQILGEAIAGEMKGTKLKILPHDNIFWKDFKSTYTNGEVLSTETGFDRDYTASPYVNYELNSDIFFPIDNESDLYHAKAPVFGLEINGKYKAYPLEDLEKSEETFFEEFAGISLQIEFDKNSKIIKVTNTDGNEKIVPIYGFWFSWYAVHPDTEVFTVNAMSDSGTSASPNTEKPEIGFLAPDFTLKDYDGREVTLAGFRGEKAVMLNFWAGWCSFCLAEMPAMAVVQQTFTGQLEVIAINRGQSEADAKSFTDSLNLSDVYTILLNPDDDIFGTYGGFAMPSTFFIDKEGFIRDIHFGPLDSKQMKKKITSKLNL